VIFDEWDQRLTFDDRPADLMLPEIDRFRNESFVALHAYPPRANTLESIPSLITGRVVALAEPVGPGDLRLTFGGRDGDFRDWDGNGSAGSGSAGSGSVGSGLAGSDLDRSDLDRRDSDRGKQAVSWRDTPNVFDAARASGRNTALVGVYHPYCRVLAASLTSCWWAEMPRPVNSTGDTFGAAMRGQTRSLLETWRLSALGRSLSTARKAREFPKALERAKAAAADPAYGFVLIHLLTPHFPHAYDRHTNAFTLGNAPLRGYYDSLALTDRAWGELRRAIEAAGLWDTTTVLLSSDHPMKHSALLDGKSDARVPFLLKLPEQAEAASRAQPFSHAQPFNTVVSGELLLEILEGRIAGPRQLSRWLGRHGEPALEASN
jgi:hypothetical protein